ncbi:MAG: phosphate ABC transporter substrate-binding protein [Bacillota bacterium]
MKKPLLYSAVLVLICLFLSGCGRNGGKDGDPSTAIRIAGSTSMIPVSQKLARAYERIHPGVIIHIEGGDSSLGVRGVAEGVVDIGSVSRPLTAEESQNLTSYTITEDSICIIVNRENPVGEMTIDGIKEVFSGKITNWKEVGGPDRPITIINREQGSGTCSTFEDIVMKGEPVKKGALITTSTGAMLSSVAGDPWAVGYVSSNYSREGVKTVSIHTGADRVFVLKRPLMYVVSRDTSGIARDYLNFCTGEEGKRILGKG